MLDQTPLLDIKPYVKEFDQRPDAKSGWVESNIHKQEKHVADDRFSIGER